MIHPNFTLKCYGSSELFSNKLRLVLLLFIYFKWPAEGVLSNFAARSARGQLLFGGVSLVAVKARARNTAERALCPKELGLNVFVLWKFSSLPPLCLSDFIQLFIAFLGKLISNLEDEDYCDSSERGEADVMAGIMTVLNFFPKSSRPWRNGPNGYPYGAVFVASLLFKNSLT